MCMCMYLFRSALERHAFGNYYSLLRLRLLYMFTTTTWYSRLYYTTTTKLLLLLLLLPLLLLLLLLPLLLPLPLPLGRSASALRRPSASSVSSRTRRWPCSTAEWSARATTRRHCPPCPKVVN